MGLRAPKPFSKAELKHVKRFVELNMGNSKCFFHSASRLSQSSKSFWLRFFFFLTAEPAFRGRPEEQWRAESYTEWGFGWLLNRCLDHFAPDSNFLSPFPGPFSCQSNQQTGRSGGSYQFIFRIPPLWSTTCSILFESNQQTALELLLQNLYFRVASSL